MKAGVESVGICVEHITMQYQHQPLFDDFSLTIPANQFTVLLGQSGIGKSSLLRLIAGLDKPLSGSIYGSDHQPLTHRMAYMGQQDLLFPWLTVIDNVMVGDRLRNQAQQVDRARHLLESVGLSAQDRQLPHTLSGGMRQRVALARTLYEDKPVILMDEPFSALDTVTRTQMQNLVCRLLNGKTVLFITHDPLEACRLGTHLKVLAGQPTTVHYALSLKGDLPRAFDDPELMRCHALLMQQIMGAS